MVEDRSTSRRPPNGTYPAELSKRITEDFGVSIGATWTHIRGPGGPTKPVFDDLETTPQYQLLKDNRTNWPCCSA